MTTIAAQPMPLPYGRVMAALLRPLQRAFLAVNGAIVGPALRLGLGRLIGNPVTGHLLLLRTRGRRTGRWREAPLGYVIREGAVWCVAGYGRRTPWFLNLLADPAVEVVLPGRRLAGRAVPVEDDAEWRTAYRALIGSFGLLGRAVAGDVSGMSDAELLARHRALPVVRIEPTDPGTEVEPGPWDEGWLGVGLQALLLAAGAAAFAFVRTISPGPRPARRARRPSPGRC